MRRILVDHARRDGRYKRGGDVATLSIEDADPAGAVDAVDPIDAFVLDRALSRLEALDPQQGRIVELRYSAVHIQETAEVMRVSSGTVKRDWAVVVAPELGGP